MKNEKKPHVIWKMFGRKSNTLLLMALSPHTSLASTLYQDRPANTKVEAEWWGDRKGDLTTATRAMIIDDDALSLCWYKSRTTCKW